MSISLKMTCNKGLIGTWVRTSRSVLCQQVFETSAYWAGQGGILYHFKQVMWVIKFPTEGYKRRQILLKKNPNSYVDFLTLYFLIKKMMPKIQ